MHSPLLDEEPISLSEARREVIPKRDGREVAPSTLFRWIYKGVRAGDGTVVRLEAVKCGNVLMTTRAAIRRFFTALTQKATFAQATDADPDATASPQRPIQELAARKLL